jgi:hypothetical protein
VTGYELDVQSLIPGSNVVHDIQHGFDPLFYLAGSIQDSFLGSNGDESEKLSTQPTDAVEKIQCCISASMMFMFMNCSVGRYNKTIYKTRCQHIPP